MLVVILGPCSSTTCGLDICVGVITDLGLRIAGAGAIVTGAKLPGLAPSCPCDTATEPDGMISPLSIASLCFRSTSNFDGLPRFFPLLGADEGGIDCNPGDPPFEGLGANTGPWDGYALVGV